MKHVKKGILLVICLAVLICGFGLSAQALYPAATGNHTVSIKWYSATYNYNFTRNGVNQWGQIAMITAKDSTKTVPLYCLELGKQLNLSNPGKIQSLEKTAVWASLPKSRQNFLRLVSIYGYPRSVYGENADAAYYATQMLFWEGMMGARTAYNKTDGTNPFGTNLGKYAAAKRVYHKILAAIGGHAKIPKFPSQTVTLKGIGSSNAVTITDTNAVAGLYNWKSSNSKVSVTKSGNSLKLLANADFSGSVTITGQRTAPDKGASGILVRDAAAVGNVNQLLWWGTLDDPVDARSLSVKLVMPTFSLTVSKQVTGELGDRAKSWHFTLSLKDGSGKACTGSYPYTGSKSGTLTLNNGNGTFTLCSGQRITLSGLPQGTSYTVTEAEANREGYLTTSTGASGVLQANRAAAFVNDLSAAPATGVQMEWGWIALSAVTLLGILWQTVRRKIMRNNDQNNDHMKGLLR